MISSPVDFVLEDWTICTRWVRRPLIPNRITTNIKSWCKPYSDPWPPQSEVVTAKPGSNTITKHTRKRKICKRLSFNYLSWLERPCIYTLKSSSVYHISLIYILENTKLYSIRVYTGQKTKTPKKQLVQSEAETKNSWNKNSWTRTTQLQKGNWNSNHPTQIQTGTPKVQGYIITAEPEEVILWMPSFTRQSAFPFCLI